jgi:hypothetical protein
MKRSLLPLALSLITLSAAAAPLVSPWDRNPPRLTNTPYTCPALVHIAADLEVHEFYRKDDPTHSIVDPALWAANRAAVKPSYGIEHELNTMADAYRTTGSRAAAHCAVTQIAAMAADNALNGAVTKGQGDFDWGMQSFREGVATVEPNGVLPHEMVRGARALHYHLYALQPLLVIAELGEANHVPLYAASNGSIHRVIALVVSGLQDPSFFQQTTGMKQDIPDIKKGNMAFAVPYLRRFGKDPAYAAATKPLAQMVATATSLSFDTIGGLPPS